MLGPLPTLPASASQGEVNNLVHRITEIGAEMVTTETTMRTRASKLSPNVVSKPNLHHALMVTLGRHGFVIVQRAARQETADQSLLQLLQTSQSTDPIVGLHFGPPSTNNMSGIVSVSGAGDCLASGFLFGVVSGLGVNTCAALANVAAALSLQSVATVPASLASVRELHVLEPCAVHVLE